MPQSGRAGGQVPGQLYSVASLAVGGSHGRAPGGAAKARQERSQGRHKVARGQAATKGGRGGAYGVLRASYGVGGEPASGRSGPEPIAALGPRDRASRDRRGGALRKRLKTGDTRRHGQSGPAAAHLVQSLPALGRYRPRRPGRALRCRSAGARMAQLPRLLAMWQSRGRFYRCPEAHRRPVGRLIPLPLPPATLQCGWCRLWRRSNSGQYGTYRYCSTVRPAPRLSLPPVGQGFRLVRSTDNRSAMRANATCSVDAFGTRYGRLAVHGCFPNNCASIWSRTASPIYTISAYNGVGWAR
jgi:hypothetical protein